MPVRAALLALSLLLASPILAGTTPTLPSICPSQTTVMRELARQADFDAPADINQLIVNVIDGKLPQVRQQLATMSSTSAARWRQSALIIATYARQPAIVEAMLDDGAEVNAKGNLPGLKCKFKTQAQKNAEADPNAYTATAKPQAAFDEAAVMAFGNAGPDGPALFTATQCADVPTMELLLRHHADVDAKPAPDVGDSLALAVGTNNATAAKLLLDHGANPDRALLSATALDRASMVEMLLDHGADPCRSNQFIRKPGATLASIGKKQGIPDVLLKRLVCPANTNDH